MLTIKEATEKLEVKVLKEELEIGGTRELIAKRLGLTPSGLKSKLRRYGLAFVETRRECKSCGHITVKYSYTGDRRKS